MKHQPALAVALCGLMFCAGSVNAAHTYPSFQCVFPMPSAQLVSPQTSITVRSAIPLAGLTSEMPLLFNVEGSASGVHTADVAISDDQKTVILTPHSSFEPAELVSVSVNVAPEIQGCYQAGALSFSFTVSPDQGGGPHGSLLPPDCDCEGGLPTYSVAKAGSDLSFSTSGLPLPCDLPPMTVTMSNSPDPGYLFLSNFSTADPCAPSYIMILDNSASPTFFRKMPQRAQDFKLQPNGLLTYYVERSGPYGVSAGCFYAMDASYTVIDSFRCANGHCTDRHELRILPDGHALLMSYDPQPVDMSAVVEGGDPHAIVIGLVIQELDQSKQPVFQWRSWDHFEITDATRLDLTASVIDYVHGNAIEMDFDGNLLISSRSLGEVTKINRETGEIIWRLGGKNNQFTFVNDPRGFSRQHAVRRIANGNITLFDNGNFHDPQCSRAVEYQLDEDNKTATLVWEYRNTPDIYGSFLGYVQRLPSGNTLICWGGTTPTLTEVRPDGTRTLEMTFPYEIYTYRAYRFDWIGQAAVPDVWLLGRAGRVELGFAQFGATDVVKYYVYQGEAPGAVAKVDSTTGHSIFIDGLVSERTYYFRVTSLNSQGVESPFSQELAVVPYGTTAVEEAEGLLPAEFVLLTNYPNPFNASTLIKYSLPRSERVSLTVYSALGQCVLSLVDKPQQAGFHEALFFRPDLASGTYICRLEAGSWTAAQKLTLLR